MRILYQLGSSWLHFGSQNLPKSRLGCLLGRLGLILERPGGVLERLERVLERLRASGARLDWNHVIRPPGSQLRQAPGADKNQREERLTTERLPTERLQKTFVETECL